MIKNIGDEKMIKIGSARVDEKGKYTNGAKGDQTGKEVAEENFYIHSYGWNVYRAKKPKHRLDLSACMIQACNNNNIGYSQNERAMIFVDGIDTDTPTNCDCSSLVCECIRHATGYKINNFTTFNEGRELLKSNLFDYVGKYDNSTDLLSGDILVTCKKGHTAIVTHVDDTINNIESVSYYPRYQGNSISIVEILSQLNISINFNNRTKIAKANGIGNYKGRANENLKLVELAKSGKLKKP